jgi:membrane-associated phospholipid phosphatase
MVAELQAGAQENAGHAHEPEGEPPSWRATRVPSAGHPSDPGDVGGLHGGAGNCEPAVACDLVGHCDPVAPGDPVGLGHRKTIGPDDPVGEGGEGDSGALPGPVDQASRRDRIRVSDSVPALWADRPKGRAARLWSRMSSIPVLAALFVLTIVLAAGPMHRVDIALDHHFLYHMAPQLMPLVQGGLDKIAGQAVCLPVLALVAIALAVRRRSWRPIVVGIKTELAFLIGIGGLKLLIARPSPPLDDPDLLDGGIFAYGEKGISFPSGHTSEAVLMYGAAVYLIAQYSRVSRTLVVLAATGVALISMTSTIVAVWLGWHWLSDLLGGLAAGALFLRIVIWWDRHEDRKLRRHSRVVTPR